MFDDLEERRRELEVGSQNRSIVGFGMVSSFVNLLVLVFLVVSEKIIETMIASKEQAHQDALSIKQAVETHGRYTG